jgi:hypothetical protein
MIVLCAVLSGVEDWVGMADFASNSHFGTVTHKLLGFPVS